MRRFKNREELEEYLDKEMFCICGALCTGLHMDSCRAIRRERTRLINAEEKKAEKGKG